MFQNPFSFDGRIRRTEYGVTYIIYLASCFLIGIMSSFSQIFYVAFLPLIWFMLAQGAKRCHDRGNPGWYQIIPLYALWMLFADSEPGENGYGENPKGVGNEDQDPFGE